MIRLKFKRPAPLTLGLILTLIFIVGLVIYFFITRYKTTDFYKDNVWVTYTSKRANLSFKHPGSWPVTAEPDERLQEDNKAYTQWGDPLTVESIDFNEEWYANAGGERLGLIEVKNGDGISSIQDYLKKEKLLEDRYVDMMVKGVSQKVLIPAPTLEYTKIGGVDAVKITNKSDGLASFSNATNKYTLVRKGFVYTFMTTDSSRFMKDKNKNTEIFNKILQSVHFTD